jgi:glycerol uptake facilitator-like aquaporin
MSTAYLAEFLGTFILVTAILLTGNPLFIAAGFLAAITMTGGISGGHLNPAVSLAMVTKGDLPTAKLPGYVVAQVAGALLALAAFKQLKRSNSA